MSSTAIHNAPLQFDEVYRMYRQPLYLYTYKRLQNREASEEVVQETFLKVWRAFSDVAEQSSIQRWIYRVTSNTIVDWYRSNARRIAIPLSLLEESESEPHAPFTDDPQCRYDVAEQVHAAFLRLPKNYRVVLYMADYEHYSHAEIAERLQVKLGTLRVRLVRARKAFIRSYAKECV